MVEKTDIADEQYTAYRSLVYKIFASAYEYPTDELLDVIREGALTDDLQETIQATYPALLEVVDCSVLSKIGDADALQIEYTRLFDSGVSGPPCPLFEGGYSESRMGCMEELIRFYNFFELTRAEDPNELPDHLCAELEFLHFLAHQENVYQQQGDDISDLQRAQRDFLIRHIQRWLPKLKGKLLASNADEFFLVLTDLLEKFISADVQYLVQLVGAGDQSIQIPVSNIDDQETKESEAQLADSIAPLEDTITPLFYKPK